MYLDSTHRRPIKATHKLIAIISLWLSNRFSRGSILGSTPVTISLTSYGQRLKIVAFAIESLGIGVARPQRFILWVSDAGFDVRNYPMLRRLTKRGLEIRHTEDYGPHKKVYPFACLTQGNEGPLATADDDILYSRYWLDRLYVGYANHPDYFVGFRAHRMTFDYDGCLSAYSLWEDAAPESSPSYLNFFTGGAGVIFPPLLLRQIFQHGDQFMSLCPRADDIWINVLANRSGLRGYVIPSEDIKCLVFPRSQNKGLWKTENAVGGNDKQLTATLLPQDLDRLRSELTTH